MKESGLVDKIRIHLKGIEGLFFWKEHGGQFGTSGLPDIVCCYKGRFIGLEVKTDKGKTTVLQEVTLRRIRNAGGIVAVVRSVDEVLAVIESVKAER
jgi:hypothetical protein